MSSRALAFTALAGLLSSAACSSGGPSDGGTNGASAGNTSGTTGSGTTGGDGGSGTSSGTTTGSLPYYGHVYFQTISHYDGMGKPQPASQNIDIEFLKGTPNFAFTCPSGGTKVGMCCYTPASADAGSGPLPQLFSAGTKLTVSVDGGASATVQFSKNGFGYLYDSHLTWDAGDDLGVVAPGVAIGAGVDAFQGAIEALPQIDYGMNGPPFPSGGIVGTPIPNNQSLVLTWNPAIGAPAGTTMTVDILDVSENTMQTDEVKCVVADSDGMVTIPQSVLASLVPGDHCEVGMTRQAPLEFQNGNADIQISAQSSYTGIGTFSDGG